MTYQIRKGIPLPERAQKRRGEFPFADMVPGDSVLIEWRDYVVATSYTQRLSRKNGYKYPSRDCGDCFGIWCVGPEDGVTTHKL